MKIILLSHGSGGGTIATGPFDIPEPENGTHPDIISYDEKLYKYSHDELVGLPKRRGHYYCEASYYEIIPEEDNAA